MKTYVDKDWYEYEYESIDLGEEELIYCKKCREFFSAFHKDYGSYFCPKCDNRKKEVWKEGAEDEVRKYAEMLYKKYNKT